MELIFIRHGQGDHTLNLPDSLQIEDPTEVKREYIKLIHFNLKLLLMKEI